MRVDVASERGEAAIRHTDGERRRMLETVWHRHQKHLHRDVPGSTFQVPGSCSEFPFEVRGSVFSVRAALRA